MMQTVNTSTKDKSADIRSVYDVGIYERKEFGTIRTMSIDGEPWFVANDVAKALGYTNPSKATNDHCKRSEVRWGNDSLGRRTEFKVIPESDLYRLIAKSQLPEAEKFESWIFDEVLPTIRKHGAYATDDVIENILNNPDYGIRLLEKLKEEKQARVEAERKNAILTHVNKTYTMTEIAKELNMKSAIELNKRLSDMKIQYKVNGTWVFYSDYSNLGYEEIKQEILDNGQVVYHRKITQLGREFILGLFEDEDRKAV